VDFFVGLNGSFTYSPRRNSSGYTIGMGGGVTLGGSRTGFYLNGNWGAAVENMQEFLINFRKAKDAIF
jgi:hypothetical protein